MTESNALLVVGSTEIANGISSVEVSLPFSSDSYARVVLATKQLVSARFDYNEDARLFALDGNERDLLFTGKIKAVSFEGAVTTVELHTILSELGEVRLGGLGATAYTQPEEMIWSMLNTGGLTEEQYRIPIEPPGDLELFVLYCPIQGLVVDEPLRVGSVVFTSQKAYIPKEIPSEPRQLRKRFMNSDSWAVTYLVCPSILEAEYQGLEEIRTALNWIRVTSLYSTSTLPYDRPSLYRSEFQHSSVVSTDVVAVLGCISGRGWLRCPTDTVDKVIIRSSQLGQFSSIPLPKHVPIDISSGLEAWSRSTREENALTAIVALWEAVEFYCAGADSSKMFSRQERKSIVQKATEGLTLEKAERVRNLMEKLNEESLSKAPIRAIKEDRVPISTHELTLLGSLRKTRNDIVHGRRSQAPTRADIRHAQSVVGRMFVFRIAKLLSHGNKRDASPEIESLVRRLLP